MSIQRRRAFSALVTSLFLLAGCGTASLSPTAPTKLPALGLDRQADLSGLGSLEVALESAEAARKVLSTIADVASYRISVAGSGGVSPVVKTCPAPTGNARKVSSLFSQLNPGDYTVTVETLDADGNLIGSATSVATVKKGVCTVVTLRVKLDPTYVKNSQGNLDVHVIVENGDVIEKPIEACKPADGFVSLDGACPASPTPVPSPSSSVSPVQSYAIPGGGPIDGDAQGYAYKGDNRLVRKIAPTGEVVQEYNVAGAVYGLGVDKFGNIWTTANLGGNVSRIDGVTGEVKNIFVNDFNTLSGLDFDTDGNAYVVNGASYVIKIAQDGTILARYFVPVAAAGSLNEIAVAPNGEMWLTAGDATNSVIRLAPDGSLIGTYGNVSQPWGICLDSQGNVWVANRGSANVTKLAPNGALLGSFPVAMTQFDITVDAQDNAWVVPWPYPENTVKLSNDGQILAKYSPTGLWVGTDGLGYVWASDNGVVARVSAQ